MTDLKLAFRQLRKSPGFTAVAVLILAVGMAANTTVFSLVNAVLFRPLPVREPDQLALITIPNSGSFFSTANFQTLRAQKAAFQDMAAYARALVLCRVGQEQTRIRVELVSNNYFAFLGLNPQVGRLLDESDRYVPNLVISDGWWQRGFNRDPSLIGRTIRVNDKPCNIVGVAPPGFGGLAAAAPVEAWLATELKGTVAPDEAGDAQVRWLNIVARLKPDFSLAAAQASIRAVEKDVMESWMFTENSFHLELARCGRGQLPAEARSVGRTIAVFLFAVMALVLLIACANLASLLVCRGIYRRREVAVRLALGASRFRLVQQLLVEALLMSLLGGALGLLMSTWGVNLLAAVIPSVLDGFSFNFSFSYDPRVVGYTLLLSVATSCACGLVPALQTTKLDLQSALKDETQGLTARTHWYGLRNMLVVGQVAVCFMLLVGGGLMLRSLGLMRKADVGFDYRSCLTASLWSRDHATPEAEYTQRLSELILAARALPGVLEACVCSHPPLGSEVAGTSVSAEDNRSHSVSAMFSEVTPGFFETLSIAVLQGRGFGTRDGAKSDKVVIVNRALGTQLWPGQNPVGHRLWYSNRAYEVVGVVGDVISWQIGKPSQAGLYFCYNQQPSPGDLHLLLRVKGPMRPMRGLVSGLVRQFDPGRQASQVQPYADIMLTAFLPQRAAAWVLEVASAVGIALVSLGLYGVLSYHVAQRTREIGLRMTLGARRGQVLGAMLRRGLSLAGMGLGAGLGLSVIAGRILEGLLYQTQPTDPLTLIVVSLLLLFIAAAACFFPARRAAKVDPMVALRYE